MSSSVKFDVGGVMDNPSLVTAIGKLAIAGRAGRVQRRTDDRPLERRPYRRYFAGPDFLASGALLSNSNNNGYFT